MASAELYGASNPVQPVQVDLFTQFPNAQGENNFYAQAYNQTSDTYRDLTAQGDYFFNPPGRPYNIPFIDRAGFLPDYIGMHPEDQTQPTNEDAVLTWVVPATGTYRLQGDFRHTGTGGDGFDYYIKKGSTILIAAHLNPGGAATYDVKVTLKSADHSERSAVQ